MAIMPLINILLGYSEDQFRSAFEIADANGDDMVTYPETMEVIVKTVMMMC